MTALIETCRSVAGHWAPWALIVALLAMAGYAAWHLRVCPLVRGTARVDPGEAAERLARPLIAGPGYAAVVVAGIALMAGGLALMAQGATPVGAFVLLAVGIAVSQGAPLWLRLCEGYDRVIAAEAEGAEAAAFARERLAGLHVAAVLTTLALAVLLGLALLIV